MNHKLYQIFWNQNVLINFNEIFKDIFFGPISVYPDFRRECLLSEIKRFWIYYAYQVKKFNFDVPTTPKSLSVYRMTRKKLQKLHIRGGWDLLDLQALLYTSKIGCSCATIGLTHSFCPLVFFSKFSVFRIGEIFSIIFKKFTPTY